MPPHKIKPECVEIFTHLKDKTEEIAKDTQEIKKAVTNHYTELSASQQRIETKILLTQTKQATDINWLRWIVTGVLVVGLIGALSGYLFAK
jgi:hypothetical protein